MKLHRRRWWPVAVVVLAVAVVAALNLLAYWWSQRDRSSTNYDQIEEGLFLGGSVPKPPGGTQAVLNLCETEDRYHAEVHEWRPIPDRAPAPDLDWLQAQVDFIDAQRQAHRQVFVHCQAGVSRGGMVVTAYLMWRHHWSRDEALEFIRSRRPEVRPNPAFMDLLKEWEKRQAETRN